MPKSKIKSIELAAFRGATQPVRVDFSPEKRVTMIYGENGSGKSSVVDAFDFLCSKEFGSLSDRKGADKDLLSSITGKSDHVRVRLTTEEGAWEASFKAGTKTILVQPGAGCPDARILRRSNILRLIDEIPSKRFEALKGYIDVSGIERSEKALGDAVRGKEAELQRHVQAYAQAENSLAQMWAAERTPGSSAEAWAEIEAAKDAVLLRAEAAEADGLISAINELDLLKAAHEQAVKRVIQVEADKAKVEGEQISEEKKVIGENPAILDVLRRALDFVGRFPGGTCPVCRQSADSAALARELTGRIASMSSLSTAAGKTEEAIRALTGAKAQAASAAEQLAGSARKAQSAFSQFKLPPVIALALPDWPAHPAGAKPDPAAEIDAAIRLCVALQAARVPLAERRDGAKATIAQRAAISGQLNQLRASRAAQQSTDALIRKLRAALEIVGSTRKAFVREVLDSVSTEIETLYSKLHPNESVGGIKLSLDPDNFGSLHLHGDFHSAKSIPPQSAFSESHLDTLGFCVFLALAKRYKTDDTIVILDDVLTSVDAQHLDRFISLIHDEEQHFSQIVITTHYRPWCERYRHHRAPGNKVHFVELRPWSLSSGIRVQQMKLCLDELRQASTVPPFDRQVVASKSGIFLESMLDFIARMYECRLPLRSRSGYTLGELTSCFSSKRLLPALKVERLTTQTAAGGQEQQVWVSIPLAPLIAQVKQWAEVRNLVGCHFNELGASCTDADVEELAKATLALGDALVCAEGGDFPSRSDSGSYHETKSKKVRLHPFAEPS